MGFQYTIYAAVISKAWCEHKKALCLLFPGAKGSDELIFYFPFAFAYSPQGAFRIELRVLLLL